MWWYPVDSFTSAEAGPLGELRVGQLPALETLLPQATWETEAKPHLVISSKLDGPAGLFNLHCVHGFPSFTSSHPILPRFSPPSSLTSPTSFFHLPHCGEHITPPGCTDLFFLALNTFSEL